MSDIERLISLCRLELGTADDPHRCIEADAWPGILIAALENGLIGPLYSVASKTDGVPGPIAERIRTAYLALAASNLQLTDILIDILQSFSDRGIQAIVLKGPALALVAHKYITIREFTDLDLLIRFEDLSATRQRSRLPASGKWAKGNRNLAVTRIFNSCGIRTRCWLNCTGR